MSLSLTTLSNVFIAFAATAIAIFILYPLALRLQLVDRPSKRKHHQGEIPVIGGIAIWVGLAFGLLISSVIDQKTAYFLLTSGLLVATSAVDDRFGLDVRIRISVEVIAASIMIYYADLWVGNLGNILALGEFHLPFWFAIVFTVVAVFGIINSFNMIDGLDGLAAAVALGSILILQLMTENSPSLSKIGPYLTGGLAAFLVFNLTVHRKIPKIFLGDAGSKLIGLTFVWVLIETAQSDVVEHQGIRPATALYIVGLPLIDMVTTSIRRVRRGFHPFRSDRSHIHHLLLRLGFSARKSLISIVALSISINFIGIMMHRWQLSEAVQFAFFVALFVLYATCVDRSWKSMDRRINDLADQPN